MAGKAGLMLVFPYSRFVKELFFGLAAGNGVGTDGGNETINLSSVLLSSSVLDAGLAMDTCTGFRPSLLERERRSAFLETLPAIPSVH